ncbi:MAG TPA: hypothetical protein DCS93_06300 [Microscillaceae bacterium]|nr:hypothetical protein [Microscillaceae bacterium]
MIYLGQSILRISYHLAIIFALGVLLTACKRGNTNSSILETTASSSQTKPEEYKPVPPKKKKPAFSESQQQKGESILKQYAESAKAINGKKLFTIHCVSCHGADGNLAIEGKILTKTKYQRPQIITQMYYGKGLMSSFKGVVSEEEMVAIAAYVISLRK